MEGFPLIYIFIYLFTFTCVFCLSVCSSSFKHLLQRYLLREEFFFSQTILLTTKSLLLPLCCMETFLLVWLGTQNELLFYFTIISSRLNFLVLDMLVICVWSMSSSGNSCQTVGKFVKNTFTPAFSCRYLLVLLHLGLSNMFQREDIWGRWMRGS